MAKVIWRASVVARTAARVCLAPKPRSVAVRRCYKSLEATGRYKRVRRDFPCARKSGRTF